MSTRSRLRRATTWAPECKAVADLAELRDSASAGATLADLAGISLATLTRWCRWAKREAAPPAPPDPLDDLQAMIGQRDAPALGDHARLRAIERALRPWPAREAGRNGSAAARRYPNAALDRLGGCPGADLVPPEPLQRHLRPSWPCQR